MEGAFRVGKATVVKIPEIPLDGFTPEALLPDVRPETVAARPEWVDPRSGRVRMSVHAWLVRVEGRTLLIDAGVGDDKPRPTLPVFDRLHTPFLRRLAEAGVAPEEVDAVVLTHLHADHVGWSTRLGEAGWVPAFPRATYVLSEREYRYARALAEDDEAAIGRLLDEAGMGEPTRRPLQGVFEDSVRPVVEAGLARLVPVDGEMVLPGLRLVPRPGHSIDHAAVVLESAGARAVFGGDLMHHPFEVDDPSLVSRFCEFPEAARRSRAVALEDLASDGARYFSSHFPDSSAGRVSRHDGGYQWAYDAPDA